MGCIYKIENKLNGKVYIGQTIQKPERRWSQHCCKSKTGRSFIKNAIHKYGKENFDFSVIDEAFTFDELNDKEKFYINEMNCISPNGYNLTEGGFNAPFTQDTKDKISAALTGRKATPEQNEANRQRSLGKKQSKETIEKRRKKMIGHEVLQETRNKIKETLIGHEVLQETRDKIREALTGKNQSIEAKRNKGIKVEK